MFGFGSKLPPEVMALMADPAKAMELMKATLAAANELVEAAKAQRDTFRNDDGSLNPDSDTETDIRVWTAADALEAQMAKIKGMLPK